MEDILIVIISALLLDIAQKIKYQLLQICRTSIILQMSLGILYPLLSKTSQVV